VSDDEVRVELRAGLDPATVEAVLALVEAATETDGVRPLSEHTMLHLRYGGDAAASNALLFEPDGALAAYGHLDTTDEVEGASAEIAVHPAHRQRGRGRTMLQALLNASPGGRMRLWAHGKNSAAGALARSMGFTQMRELWQMRRSLYAQLDPPSLPAGVTVRTFRPGEDDSAWVALNALAFAAHPEQGQWTLEDLSRRVAEAWFDPEGFFLAERDGRMVGFHWTKVHGGPANEAGDGHGHERIGEVYVVGVDPAEHGNGLGTALTLVGLGHLRGLGLAQVMLYVDADNAAAIRLYRKLGFTHWDTDTMFRR
jgi:mycothiol synthase